MFSFNQVLSVAVVLAVFAIQSGEAVKCYTCSSCSVPFDIASTGKAENCGACKTTIIDRKPMPETRKECVNSCVEAESGNTEINCCETDFCNAAPSKNSMLISGFAGLLACLTLLAGSRV